MNFDISRLRRSDQIIGVGAIAFFVVLFLFKWYGGSVSSPVGGVNIASSANGWHTFTNSRWIWIITIIVALGLVVLDAAQRQLDIPVQRGVLVAGLGALSTLFILYRIVHHPSGGATSSFGVTHVSYSYGIKIGIWLGLIAAAVITYGGYLAMQDEGTSLTDVREQASGAFSGLAASSTGSGRTAPAPESSSATGAAPTAASSGAASSGAAPATEAPSGPPIPPVAPPPGPEAAGEPPSQL